MPRQTSSSSASNSSDGMFGASSTSLMAMRAWFTETFFKPSKAKSGEERKAPDRPMTDEEKRLWIRSLEPVERKWGYILSVYGALVALIVQLQYIVGNPWVREKISTIHGHTKYGFVNQTASAEMLLGIGLALMAGAAVATYFKKRAPLAFLLMIGAFASTSLLGLPMLILAGWLFMRSWRVQRYGSPDAKVAAKVAADKRARGERQGIMSSLFGRGGSTATATTSGTTVTATAVDRSAPEASKRYTPKKERPKDDKSRGNRYATTGRTKSGSKGKG